VAAGGRFGGMLGSILDIIFSQLGNCENLTRKKEEKGILQKKKKKKRHNVAGYGS
jgi:hypothetical protein